MSSVITDARNAIAAALGATGAQVFTFVPQLLTPPALILAPDDPWLIPAQSFGDWTAKYVVHVLVSQGAENNVVSDELDALVLSTAKALRPFGSGPVAKPYIDTTYSIPCLATTISINSFIEGGQ